MSLLYFRKAAVEEAERLRKAAVEEAERHRKEVEEAERLRKAAVEEAERLRKAAAIEAVRQRKVDDHTEDIADLKAFFNTQCGLPKSASGRCSEALAVDHNIASVALMKLKSRSDFAAILSSIGLSADETTLVIQVTHPAVTHAAQSNIDLNSSHISYSGLTLLL
jgi:hypothetical protein